MSFGKILNSLLVEHEMTQLELASAIGYTQRAVSKWVNEQAEPSESAIKKSATFFNVSTDYLLGRSEDNGFINTKSAMQSASDKLTKNEQELLDWYRGLPSENARASFLSFIRSDSQYTAKRN